MSDNVKLAERLFSAIAAGDVVTVRECYSADTQLVNATTGSAMGIDAIGGLVEVLAREIPDFRYEQVRCEPTPTGFVQQHVIRGTSPQGKAFSIPACCVALVRDGQVTRLDEYADAAALATLGL